MKTVLALSFMILAAGCVTTRGVEGDRPTTPTIAPGAIAPGATASGPSDGLDPDAENQKYSAEEMDERALLVESAIRELGWQGRVGYDLLSQRFRIDVDELPALFGTNGSDLAVMLAATLTAPDRPDRIDVAAYELRVIVHTSERSNRPCQECAIR